MTALYIILGLAVVVCGGYILMIRCRKGHPGLEALQGHSYAHRGLHGNGIPENSMTAFRLALEKGYGIELDVHLMKDGTLAVIHDASLLRTAGVDVKIEDLTLEDLDNYRLEGTEEKIPLFDEVLDLFEGKAPMIIELKAHGNAGPLTEAVCNRLERYSGVFCLESFDPRCIYWLKKNRPQLIRGQLSEDYSKNPKRHAPAALEFLLAHQLENFLTVPDFVAYRFSDRNLLGVRLVRKIWGAQGVTWTIKSQEDHDAAVAEGFLPIFEGFEP